VKETRVTITLDVFLCSKLSILLLCFSLQKAEHGLGICDTIFPDTKNVGSDDSDAELWRLRESSWYALLKAQKYCLVRKL
jgi:hypothetical protein